MDNTPARDLTLVGVPARFHIGAVLTIITGNLVAPGLMEDVYGILNHMSRESLYTHQLPRVSEECAPYLAAAFPDLSSDAMKAEVADVCEKIGLAQKLGASNVSSLLTGWLADLARDLGYSEVEVGQLPEDAHKWRDPFAELVAMRGGDASTVITVTAGEEGGDGDA